MSFQPQKVEISGFNGTVGASEHESQDGDSQSKSSNPVKQPDFEPAPIYVYKVANHGSKMEIPAEQPKKEENPFDSKASGEQPPADGPRFREGTQLSSVADGHPVTSCLSHAGAGEHHLTEKTLILNGGRPSHPMLRGGQYFVGAYPPGSTYGPVGVSSLAAYP